MTIVCDTTPGQPEQIILTPDRDLMKIPPKSNLVYLSFYWSYLQEYE